MDRRIRTGLLVLSLTVPAWFGTQLLAGYLQPASLATAVEERTAPVPQKIAGALEPELQAAAAYAVLAKEGEKRELFARNAGEPLPIASLAKLMTALVAAERYEAARVFEISQQAAATPESFGQLQPGDRLLAEDLIAVLLVESSNDAAAALAEPIGEDRFVERMNNMALALGMAETSFGNPTGLDPRNGAEPNRSSAKDLALLLASIQELRPNLFAVLGMRKTAILSADGSLHHTAANTNELLDRKTPLDILAGKTGLTPQAKGCLIVAAKPPSGPGTIIAVVLGSDDRFQDMENLLSWVKTGYLWP